MQLSASSVLKRVPLRLSLESLAKLFADYQAHDFQIRLWDGTIWGDTKRPRFTLILKRPAALRHLLSSPNELTLGESYIFDDFDVEGDIEAAVAMGDYLLAHDKSNLSPALRRLASLLEMLPERDPAQAVDRSAILQGAVHSRKRDRQAISYHYDLPPEFFALWLDQRRMYSSAYFKAEETISRRRNTASWSISARSLCSAPASAFSISAAVGEGC